MKPTKTRLIVAAVLLAALAFLVYKTVAQRAPSDGLMLPEEDVSADVPGGASTLLVGNNAIAVFSQPAGESVATTLVILEDGGYVVLHESTNGVPGAIIGSSEYLSAGAYDKLEVSFDTPQENGQEVIAMLHRDNGDQVFNAGDDAAVVENGGPIFTVFQLNSEAEIPSEIAL